MIGTCHRGNTHASKGRSVVCNRHPCAVGAPTTGVKHCAGKAYSPKDYGNTRYPVLWPIDWLGAIMSERSYNTPLTVKMVQLVGEREKRIYSRQGVNIRVGAIAQQSGSLICTVHQFRKSPLARPIGTLELVLIAESALAPLLNAGFTPMITAVDWAHGDDLRRSTDAPDALDPVGLISALKESGLPFPRLNSASEETVEGAMELPFWRRALSSMFASF